MTNDWTDGGNWLLGAPSSGDSVTMNTGATGSLSIVDNSISLLDLTNSGYGGILRLDADLAVETATWSTGSLELNGQTLTVGSSFSYDGSATTIEGGSVAFDAGGGVITLTDSAGGTGDCLPTVYVTNGTLQLQSDVCIENLIVGPGGAIDYNGFALFVDTSVTLGATSNDWGDSIGGGSLVFRGGAATWSGAADVGLANIATGSTVSLTGAVTATELVVDSTLSTAGQSLTSSGTVTVNSGGNFGGGSSSATLGDLIVNTGGIFGVSSGTTELSGDLTVAGTWNAGGGGTLAFTGAAAQAWVDTGAGNSFGNVALTGGAAQTVTATTDLAMSSLLVSAGGALEVTGAGRTFTVSGATEVRSGVLDLLATNSTYAFGATAIRSGGQR